MHLLKGRLFAWVKSASFTLVKIQKVEKIQVEEKT